MPASVIIAACKSQSSELHQNSEHVTDLRSSGKKLNTAVIRRRVVATRGFDNAFLICVSAVLLAVRPTLSVAYTKTA